jgi:hypothetical protein
MAKAKQLAIDEIKERIEKNFLNFWEKPKAAIKKALGDLKPSLDLSILSDGDQLQDDPDKLIEIIINHFKKILDPKPFNLDSLWIQEYTPRSSLPNNIFHDAIAEITLEEINETLLSLPKLKSPGLSLIPYEAWINLGPEATKHIKNLFNLILNSSNPPIHWKHSVVTLLPKKII